MTIRDADGHVTETQDQIVKYLDEPYRRRPSGAFFYPWDGWDRRLLGTLGDWAGDAETWLRALDKGGVDQTVLYPTLGLFLSFLRDRQWAVALCRAYNTFLHEHFVKVSPRLQAVALRAGPRRGGRRAAAGGARARPRRRDARRRRPARARGLPLPRNLRRSPAPERHARHSRLRLAPGRCRRGPVSELHPDPHVLPRLRADAPAHLDDLRRRARKVPAAPRGVPRGGLRVGAVLDGAHGRRVRQAAKRGAGAQEAAERVRAQRDQRLLVRGRGVAVAAGARAGRRE